MRPAIASVVAALCVTILPGVCTAAKAAPVAFNFEFEVPEFAKPELLPLNHLFVENGIAEVSGKIFYDTDDAFFVTSEFTLMSNIDALFDQAPDELVFAPSGNLNQVRSWEVELSGNRFLLQLTGLDPTNELPNRWFGQAVLPGGPAVSDLTDAGGGLTPISIPEPATSWLVAIGLLLIGAVKKSKDAIDSILPTV